MNEAQLKSDVASYWNNEACGTDVAAAQKFTKEYFEEIEEHRYRVEPEIFSFAQFTRFRGKKVLEVGIGAGTDFMQWVRAGAQAYGVDLTQEAVEHVQHRLEVFGLAAEDIRIADAENLPFDDNTFDLIYSWGVIHHSPNTIKAFEEILRCVKPGGTIKLMIYNKRSIFALYKYLRYSFLKGRPFRSMADVMFHHQESPGTKVYTIPEVKNILSNYPVEIKEVKATATDYDLQRSRSPLIRIPAYLVACILGFEKCGWFLTIEVVKK